MILAFYGVLIGNDSRAEAILKMAERPGVPIGIETLYGVLVDGECESAIIGIDGGMQNTDVRANANEVEVSDASFPQF